MTAVIERTTVTTTYLRTIGDQGEITGYLAIWGSPELRDSYGTWFDESQPPDLGLKDGEFLPVRLLYEHGLETSVQKEIIGKIVEVWRDKVGIGFRAFLDKAGNFFNEILDEIREKKLAVSSGSAGHLADFDDEGRFVNWYLSEVSLTSQPSESRMPTVSLIRSGANVHQLRSQIPDNPTNAGGNPIGAQASAADCGCDGGASDKSSNARSSNMTTTNAAVREGEPTITAGELGISPDMTLAQLIEAIVGKIGADAAKAALDAAMPSAQAEVSDAPATPEMMTEEGRSKALARALYNQFAKNDPQYQMNALRKQVETLQASIQAQMTAAVQTPPPVRVDTRAQNISVSEPRKYWHLSHNDMLFGHMVMRSHRIQPSEEYLLMMGGKVTTAYEKGDKHLNDPAVRSIMPSTRANEVATSTATGGGDEFVAIAWSTQIWEAARNARIYDQLVAKGMRVVEVPQGHESIYIMTEGADPTVYTIAQDADLAASGRPDVNIAVTRIGTGRVLLTPGEVGMAVAYSDVFEEDSLIPVLAQYNYQMTEKAAETVEQLFINGDTDGTINTNINLIDGTPGTGLSAPYYLATNGALKYALVTGTSTSRDGAALDENDYRLTMKLLPSAVRARRDKLAFVIDPDTHNTSLNVTAIKTDDVRRTNATITSGVLTNIYGVDVFESGFMPLANNVGKVPNAGGTLGRILCVYAPFWTAGWKRKITIKTQEDIISGDTLIVAKMRLGFAVRGAGASTVSYNLTIA